MRLEFHRQIASDISRIMDYYEDVAGPKLADEFYSELRSFFQKAADSPEAYDVRERDLRRVNLKKFHTIFYSVSLETEYASWLTVTAEDDHRWAFTGNKINHLKYGTENKASRRLPNSPGQS